MDESLMWRRIFYASMSVLTVWLILKVTGVINTPVWLEYGVPIGSFIVGFVAFAQGLTNDMRQVHVMMAILATKLDGLTKRVDHLDEDVECIKDNLSTVKEVVLRHDIVLGSK